MHMDAEPWVFLSDEDLATAEAMLATERYRHVSAMCQQALEKRLKALIVERKGEMPPKSHTLPRLAREAGLEVEEAVRKFLVTLTDQYLTMRYPTPDGRVPEAQSPEQARSTLDETRRVIGWLDTLLK